MELKINSFRKRTQMYTKWTSDNFSLISSIEYKCQKLQINRSLHQQTASASQLYCGECQSCEIVNKLNGLKQWFDRASHMSIKKLLFGLLERVKNMEVYLQLNNVLAPILKSKDLIYSRNKYLPSCPEDYEKVTNNRCLSDDYVDTKIEELCLWYSLATSNYVKMNFILSILNKCDQAIVVLVVLKLKSIVEAHFQENLEIKSRFSAEESESEIECDAYDEDEDGEDINNNFDDVREEKTYENENKNVDFIRYLPFLY
jgi:hypothetical protein